MESLLPDSSTLCWSWDNPIEPESIQKNTRINKNAQEYTRIEIKSTKIQKCAKHAQEYARVHKSIQEYTRVCKSIQEYTKIYKFPYLECPVSGGSYGHMKSRLSPNILQVWISLSHQQHVNVIITPMLRCQMESRLSIVIPNINVCLVTEENTNGRVVR